MTKKRLDGCDLKTGLPSIPVRIIIQGIIIGISVIMTFIPSFSAVEGLHLIRIGTGGKTGVYYPIGNIIAHGLANCQT
jgi:TRAP-type uncharacterized transport system substrate-binding protein